MEAQAPEIIYNIIDTSDSSLTLILGIEKPALRNFGHNNIQMVVGNIFDYYPEKIDLLEDAIRKNRIRSLNIIGMSKTCTAAVIYAAELTEIFKDLSIHLFLFSPYTTLSERFYRENSIIDGVPRSLKLLWAKQSLDEEFLRYRDVASLAAFNNVQVVVIYPRYGTHCEPQCVARIANQNNVVLVPLSVSTHAVLLPFWNQLRWNLKIEAFENEYAYLSIEDYWYYRYFQKVFTVRETLYELIFSSNNFINRLNNFNENIGKKRMPYSFILIFTCVKWYLKVDKFIARNMRKLKKRISQFPVRFRNHS
jgi:hypothetical protein